MELAMWGAGVAGALLGAFLMWGVQEFVWRGRLIKLKKALEKEEPEAKTPVIAAPAAQPGLTESERATIALEKTVLRQKADALQASLDELQNKHNDLQKKTVDYDAEKFLITAAKNQAEYELQKVQKEKAQLETQVSRLQIEKGLLDSELERYKFIMSRRESE